MATYKYIGPDDQVDIKGGEKFVVLTKDGLLPDGRLQEQRDDQTDEEYVLYIRQAITKVVMDLALTADQVRRKVVQAFAPPRTASAEYRRNAIEAAKAFLDPTQELWRARLAAQQNAVWKSYLDWCVEITPFQLQRNDCTRVHRLREAGVAGHVMGAFSVKDNAAARERHREAGTALNTEHTFIVQHDWYRVLGDTNPELHEWELPYPSCIFEFRVAGRTALLSAHTLETQAKEFSLHVELSPEQWVVFDPTDGDPLGAYLMHQVAATCVVIEAKVATHEVVRQPTAVNAKRIKAGKSPMLDFHLVDLSKKHRGKPLAEPASESGIKMRLHFVRGHWRQYEAHRTRIEWHLRGDPALGFVDKLYSI